MSAYRVSVDVGGTFTDLVALNEKNGNLVTIKVPSTPEGPEVGFFQALKQFLTDYSPTEITQITHATTIAVNALLGQIGLELPKIASISTSGFRDVLEIGRQRRHELYNLFLQKPQVIIPRKLRYEINERVNAKGEILEALNKNEVQALANLLAQKAVKAVAVTLLFSYTNSEHEKIIEKILKTEIPSIFISRSSEVAPEQREYERTSTTAVNACIMPILSSYLNSIVNELEKLKINTPMCMMQSDGGLATKQTAITKPVSMVESGPAAGVVACSTFAQELGLKNILSFDMGGTTAKAGIIQNGKPAVVMEYEVAGKIHSGRIVKGSGYPVLFPFIDLAECSAGGGTIAWIDEGGSLKVGPVSAGANPGPACYGQGGLKPTVTDANLLLGRLNPAYILNGKMKLHQDLSKKAFREISAKSSLRIEEASAGIIKIVNSQMSKILRIVSVERGFDPRTFTLISYGGAGPIHACDLAEELHISKIVVPPNPGLFSAYGLLAADFTSDFVQAITEKTGKKPSDIENLFGTLQRKAMKTLTLQGIKPEKIIFSKQLDMRYSGQSYELTIPVFKPLTKGHFKEIVKEYHQKHKAVYGYERRQEPIEVVNVRLTAVGLVNKPKLIKEKKFVHKEPQKSAISTTRNVYFEKHDCFKNTPIYLREKLRSGDVFSGPAVIEQYDSTTVVNPGWAAEVDLFGNLVLTLSGRASTEI